MSSKHTVSATRVIPIAAAMFTTVVGLTTGITSCATAGSPPVAATGGVVSASKWLEYTPEGKVKRPPFNLFRK